eukprot:TRINITY_DN1888_c0_g1_i1.p1 TRINITY_DN1888_c0_g1~~TRINITY_DN1888_c0_g1_i1.p1  ORF type:complete len:1154 (-),score=257.11 TRINITY_DN1888_c0_g1_i1:36-3497(-)
MRLSPLSAALLATFFFCCWSSSGAYPCASSSTTNVNGTDVANFPQFPTASVSSSLSFVENHWSEVAQMARPPAFTASSTVQTNCPHLRSSGLMNWHDSATWGSSGVPTSSGQNITLPANSSVLVSGCSLDPNVVFGYITIPQGSELIFGDANITLQAQGIEVRGAFRIGSPTCRIKSFVNITLWGSRSAQTFPASPLVKGIYVNGNGVLDVFGARYYPTWSRLAVSASPGDVVIYVQDIVNWQVGQSVVITTTELKDSRDFTHNEVRNIVSVVTIAGKNVSQITLDNKLAYFHYGGREYQAEVGLLSRNILVQGDPQNSEPTDISPVVCYDLNSNYSSYPCSNTSLTGFGGHIFVTGTSTARVSGLELFRMGQTNILARYPFHLHLLLQLGNNSFITDSAVHRSFYRCFSVHQTHNSLVSENVAFDAIGHCYYLEEGVEENNTFSYNLGAHIHFLGDNQNISQGTFGSFYSQTLGILVENPKMILPADFSASPFYITNAMNFFLGNAASGGWAGYAFPNLPQGIKLSQSTKISPKNRPLGLFKGNTAHSTAYWWQQAGAIYLGGQLSPVSANDSTLLYWPGRVVNNTRDTCSVDTTVSVYCSAANYVWTRFEDNKVFLTNGRGMQHWGNRAEIIRFEAHDCGLSMNVFGQVWVDNMLINCRSDQYANITRFNGCPTVNGDWWKCSNRDYTYFTSFGGFQWYDVGQTHIVTNSVFRNCNNMQKCLSYPCGDSAPWTLLTHSDQFVPDQMQVTKNVTYQNVNSTYLWKFTTKTTDSTKITVSGKLQNWRDLDGSVDGSRRGRTQMGSIWSGNWWKMNSNCTVQSQMWVCPMKDLDFAASIYLNWNATWQSQIGNTVCMNGGGAYPCPNIANVTRFGGTEGTDSLLVGVNAKITGPVTYESGGWFIRFPNGTPSTLVIDQVQVYPQDVLLIALPYPAGTVFNITAGTASWCGTWNNNVCNANFSAVGSVAAVVNGSGNVYFYDSAKYLLYMRIVQQTDSSIGDSKVWKQMNLTQLTPFVRGGVTLIGRSGAGNYKITIAASNCGTANAGLCDLPSGVAVPALLRPEALASSGTTDGTNNGGGSSGGQTTTTTTVTNGKVSSSTMTAVIGGSVGGAVVIAGAVVAVVLVKRRGGARGAKHTTTGTVATSGRKSATYV